MLNRVNVDSEAFFDMIFAWIGSDFWDASDYMKMTGQMTNLPINLASHIG